jgi:hypothetical protein
MIYKNPLEQLAESLNIKYGTVLKAFDNIKKGHLKILNEEIDTNMLYMLLSNLYNRRENNLSEVYLSFKRNEIDEIEYYDNMVKICQGYKLSYYYEEVTYFYPSQIFDMFDISYEIILNICKYAELKGRITGDVHIWDMPHVKESDFLPPYWDEFIIDEYKMDRYGFSEVMSIIYPDKKYAIIEVSNSASREIFVVDDFFERVCEVCKEYLRSD